MQVGSLVETVADFSDVRSQWGFPYPEKGDLLVISLITDHPNAANRRLGIVLLHFEELPELIVGVCDKKIDGTPNFVEVLPPMEEDYQEVVPTVIKSKKPKLELV